MVIFMKRLIAFARALVQSYSRRERFIIAWILLCAVISGVFVLVKTINAHTQTIPTYGGTYTEGIVGQPSFANPILAPQSDLALLLFANINDLAESITHDDQYKAWTVRIKEDARWHDGTPITTDDIIFTVGLIQNADTLSPLFPEWQGIMPARVSEREMKFHTASGYAPFQSLLLNNLRPIPKKLFADIAPSNIRLSQYNNEPVGSGPFAFVSLEKRKDAFITTYTMKANPFFKSIKKEPYIKTLILKFFENKDELIKAYNKGLIDGFGAEDAQMASRTTISTTIKKIPTTKQYTLFINQNANTILGQQTLRKALKYAINKEELIRVALKDNATVAYGPIPTTLDTYNKTIEKDELYDPQTAQTLLEQAGWKRSQEGTWERGIKDKAQTLSITIKTADSTGLKEIAHEIKKQWEQIGITTIIKLIDPQRINEDVIKTRDYELLLFGSTVALQPELFSFWHSSEKFAPGLNLSLYENTAVDAKLAALRKALPQSSQRKQLLEEIQLLINKDIPAIFIASPLYVYAHRSSIKGIAIDTIAITSDRFANINQWHLKTKRVLR